MPIRVFTCEVCGGTFRASAEDPPVPLCPSCTSRAGWELATANGPPFSIVLGVLIAAAIYTTLIVLGVRACCAPSSAIRSSQAWEDERR